MGVSLSKGGNVSLTKEAPGLTAVIVGLGWDVRTTTGTDFISLGNPRTHHAASPSRAEYTSMRKLAGARINDGPAERVITTGVEAPLSASGRGFCQRTFPSLRPTAMMNEFLS